jgi:hypothetical protein
MRRVLFVLTVVLAIALVPSKASAAPIDLFQWVFNVDGTVYDSFGVDGSSTLPGGFSLTPAATGAQGTLNVTISGAGPHSLVSFYDYELDEILNGFTNEYATIVGAPSAGQSYEVDEPGFVFGDIYTNVLAGTLDNTNAVGAGSADDVSVGLGWNFVLTGAETAVIALNISTTAPVGGFYIQHSDEDTATTLYYSSSINISGGGPVGVPEPATLLMLGIGFCALGGARFRRTSARG